MNIKIFGNCHEYIDDHDRCFVAEIRDFRKDSPLGKILWPSTQLSSTGFNDKYTLFELKSTLEVSGENSLWQHLCMIPTW